MVGAFLSTLLPPTEPAAAVFPALSDITRELVTALAVSVPAGTLVVTVKPGLAGLAKPEVASEAVHAMVTSLACQAPSATPQDAVGEVTSRLTVTDLLVVPPALVALQVNVVPPVSLVNVVESQPDC